MWEHFMKDDSFWWAIISPPHNIGINLSSAVEIEHLTTQKKALKSHLANK